MRCCVDWACTQRRCNPGTGDAGRFPTTRLLAEVQRTPGAQIPQDRSREATRVLRELSGSETAASTNWAKPTDPGAGAAWVWADPRNSFLGFFLGAGAYGQSRFHLGGTALPKRSLAALSGYGLTQTTILEQWAGFNRASVVQCSEFPGMVLGYEELISQPKAGVLALAGVSWSSVGLSVTGGMEDAVEIIERAPTLESVP